MPNRAARGRASSLEDPDHARRGRQRETGEFEKEDGGHGIVGACCPEILIPARGTVLRAVPSPLRRRANALRLRSPVLRPEQQSYLRLFSIRGAGSENR